MVNTSKTCTKCGITKSTSEFYTDRGKSRPECKSCTLTSAANYRSSHRANRAARQRVYNAAHRDKYAANQAAWRKANPDKKRIQNATYRHRHPDVIRAKWHRRRARLLDNGGSYTAADIERIRDAQGGRCCYCGAEAKLTVDHIVPLSRGGTNWPDNIALACQRCNDSKGSKLLSEWQEVCIHSDKPPTPLTPF